MEIFEIIEAVIIVLIFVLMFSLIKSKKKLNRKKFSILFFINILLIAQLAYYILSLKPEIEITGPESMIIQVNTEYVEQGARVHFYGKDLSSKLKIESNLDNKKLGSYTIKYILEYGNKEIIKERTVNIIDNIAPSINLKGKEEVKVPKNSEYIEDGYTAIDNYDGDITNKVQISKEEVSDTQYKLNYIVTDSSNNTRTVTRIITSVKAIKKEDETKNGTIYLTFDDGPSLDVTPKILDILKEENIKATFFILNYDKNREFLVKRIVEEGHSIGIHGYSHNYKEVYSSVDAYMDNITKLEEKILNSTGVVTKITRFPGGSSNTISKYYTPGIMTKLTRKLLNEGYYYFDWNVSSGDAGDVKTSEGVYENVTTGLSKKRPNIVLMHDFSGNTKTLESLKSIIEFGKSNGYSFDKIKSDTPMITHKVAN